MEEGEESKPNIEQGGRTTARKPVVPVAADPPRLTPQSPHPEQPTSVPREGEADGEAEPPPHSEQEQSRSRKWHQVCDLGSKAAGWH